MILAIILLAGVVFWYFKNKNQQLEPKNVNTLPQNQNKNENATIASFNPKICVWITPWNLSQSRQSLEENFVKIDQINPVAYEVISGKLQKRNADFSAILSFAKEKKIKVVPLISAGGREAELAISDNNKNQLISEIIELSKDYDGMEIDFENLPENFKTPYSTFTKLLGERLKANGKSFSLTVFPKTKDDDNYPGTSSEDYPTLAASADSIKIMAYDYHKLSGKAGPTSPKEWVGQVLQYATAKIPKEKIILALPLYGYSFSDNTVISSATYQKMTSTASAADVNIMRNQGQPYFETGGKKYWFEDSLSITDKYELAKSYDIGGLAFWYLGGEDQKIWQIFN